jgi:aldehyde dehydrogenase (NAD+)
MTATAERRYDEPLPKGLLIGSERIQVTSGGHFDHYNPATGELQNSIPLAGAKEVDAAVAAARAAAFEWRKFAPGHRRDVLLRVAELFREREASLARILTLEMGVPASMSQAMASEIPASWFAYYAGWAEKIEGSTIRDIGKEGGKNFLYTAAEPYGVIAAIIPWNGPLVSIGMKVAAALAAGNCVVLKPPELAPYTSLCFGEMCLEAGIPPGVVNVIVGGAEAGDALVRHPDIDKISFTGGIATARHVMQGASESLTPVVLELGGKSANIIFGDAAVPDVMSKAIFSGAALLSGQSCAIPSRLLVQDSAYDECVEMAVAVAEQVKVGDPFDAATVMGPVISAAHCERIESIIARARAEKAGRLITGGKRLGGSLSGGYFLPPTVFADVDNSSNLAQEEVFGPVLSLIPFRDEDEAIKLANETRYGLAAYVWTNDLRRAHRLSDQLEAGQIWVNAAGGLPPNAPYGGLRDSGYGKEGGKEGVQEFLRIKSVQIGLD